MRVSILIATLLCTTGASAQEMWVVGSTTELLAQGRSINALWCLDHPECVANYSDPADFTFFDATPYGLGDVDCAPVGQSQMDFCYQPYGQEYQGQSTYRWEDVITDVYALPQPCFDHYKFQNCGTIPGEWATFACEVGFTLCCQ